LFFRKIGGRLGRRLLLARAAAACRWLGPAAALAAARNEMEWKALKTNGSAKCAISHRQ